jgi:hypothetical protein
MPAVRKCHNWHRTHTCADYFRALGKKMVRKGPNQVCVEGLFATQRSIMLHYACFV